MVVPKKMTYDLVVIGGGTAGIAAAYAAATIGKKVALLESAPYLGGKATAAYVGTICGAFLRSESKIGQMVCGGFPKKIVATLASKSQTKVSIGKEGIQFLPYDQFQFKILSEHICKEAGVHIYLQSTAFALDEKDKKITSVHAMVSSDKIRFDTGAVVDCSGTAVVADLLDLETISSDKYQASAKVFGLSGLPKDLDIDNLKLALYRGIKKGIAKKAIDTRLQHLSIIPGSYKNGNVFLKIGLPTIIDGQVNQLTSLNIEGRKLIQEITVYIKSEVSYFQNAIISQIPSEVGIRTGKRHLGKTILSKAWVLASTKNERGIARGSWPLEKWNYGHKPEMEYFASDDYYDIIPEVLCSNQLSNLYFGGRNISADDGAISSARVIGTCLQTGFAAGILAVRAPEEIHTTINEIQTKLELRDGN